MNNSPDIKIKVLSGSVRKGRFNEKPVAWIAKRLEGYPGVDVEVLDLKDYEMPFFNESTTPSQKQEPYKNPIVAGFTAKIAEADGFIMVTPEYNHAPPAVLKNAIDWVGPEWAKKPVAFVGYGVVGGSRAIEQLRNIVSELQMADIRNALLIQAHDFFPVLMGQKQFEDIAERLEKPADEMIAQLIWWTRALKAARIPAEQ